MYIITKKINESNEEMNIVCDPCNGDPMLFDTPEEAESFKERFGFSDGTVMSTDDVDMDE